MFLQYNPGMVGRYAIQKISQRMRPGRAALSRYGCLVCVAKKERGRDRRDEGMCTCVSLVSAQELEAIHTSLCVEDGCESRVCFTQGSSVFQCHTVES